MDRLERLLDLVHVLQTSPTPVSLAELRDSFPDYAEGNDEAIRRKFERDKAELARIGIVLRYVSGDEDEPGYVVDAEASYLPEIDLSPADRALLARAGRAALAAEGFPYRRALRLALGKLGVAPDRLVGRRGDSAATLEDEGVILRHPAAELRSEESALVSTIVDAIARRKRVSIEHLGRDGRRTERDVDPYGVFSRDGAWYLVGHDHLRGAIRVFRLAKIRRVAVNARRPTEPDYAFPAGVHPRDYARPAPHRFAVHEEIEARVWVHPEVAFLLESSWGAPDERSVFHVRTTHLDAIVDQVLWLGERAELLSPVEGRDAVVHALDALIAAHEVA